MRVRPSAATALNARRKLRTLLSRIGVASGSVVLIGDSISEFYDLSAGIADHWFNRFREMAVGDVDPGSEISLTNFDAAVQSRYSWTHSGSISNAATGPVGNALVLASGAITATWPAIAAAKTVTNAVQRRGLRGAGLPTDGESCVGSGVSTTMVGS